MDSAAGKLCALYVSLNRPVVTLDGLPVGPAVAALACHGGAGSTLLVRSVRTGTVAFLHANARSGADGDGMRQVALSRAEALGFLFEEQAALGGPGLARSEWPAWVDELFPGVPERRWRGPLAACLSKFRWTPRSDASHPPGGQEGERCGEA